MNCRCIAFGLSLIGGLFLLPGLARCSDRSAAPLQLRLATANASQHLLPTAPARAGAPRRGTAISRRGHPGFVEAQPNVRQRALQSLLASSEQVDVESLADTGGPNASFRFERQGSAARDLSRGYKAICDKVATKLWDEPEGKRIRFDVAGKPGVAMEIPLH